MELTEALNVEPTPPKRRPGRPKKTAAVTVAPKAADVAMPAEMVGMLLSLIDRYQAKLDAEPTDENSREALREILREHGSALKHQLRPENQLHPDISAYNPMGERDHARPALVRPCFFMGVPLEQPHLSRIEIELLNAFKQSVECKERRWKATMLRDAAGGEVLYLSVPYRTWDDLRGLGGLVAIIKTIQGEGTVQNTDQVLVDRIAKLESIIAAMQAAAPSAPATVPEAATV